MSTQLSPERIQLEFRKRPCTWIAMAQIAGTLLAEQIVKPTHFSASLLLLAIILTLVQFPQRYTRTILGITLVSWANHQWHTRILSHHDLRLLLGNQPRIGSVAGTISSAPTSRAVSTDDGTKFRSQFILKAEKIRLAQSWRPAKGNLHVRVNQSLQPNLYQGTLVTVEGCLAHPKTPQVPGGFNARRHLRNQGIHYELQLRDWSSLLVAPNQSTRQTIPARFQEWARSALAIGQPDDNQSTKLIWAMVLGWRTWLSGEMREPFLLSGTLHVFAISGLHIAMIAGMMAILARCLGIPRRHAGYIIIPILWLYTAATGSPASAVRASTVSSVILLGWILGRPPDMLNSLGAAVILLLLVEPLQLFQPGFQLSFTVVLILTLIYPKLNSLSQYAFPDHALISPQSTTQASRFFLRLALRFWAALSVSVAAWLGSLPLVAIYFNLATPISLLTNLLLVPMAGITMASSFMALLTAPWLPSLASIANSSAWFWMNSMIHLCTGASQVPGGHFTVPAPSTFLCLLYYVVIAIAAFASSKRTIVIVGSVGAILATCSVGLHYLRSQEQTTITFLPIPAADAIFIDAPGRRNDWMIDGGPLWSAPRLVDPFLKNQPLTSNYQNHLVTHGDKQHIEILPSLFEARPPTRVIISPMRFRSSFYRQLVDETQGHPIETLAAPDSLGPWHILYPHSHTNPSPADDATLVLLGNLGGLKLLFLSDLDRAVQKELLNHDPTLEVDLISLNLPNGLAPPNDFVLKELNPQVILVTGSDSPKGDRWVHELRNSFSETQTKTFFTGTDGTITLKIAREGSILTTISGHQYELINRSH